MSDVTKLPNFKFDDYKVWDMLGRGFNKGVFQMESRLLKKWLKKVKPRNTSELSAVISIVRPGALDTGQAERYSEVKENAEKLKSMGHPIIDEILSTTYGAFVYQEQLMLMGSRLAWVDLDEIKRLVMVDKLRKGVGKKNQEALNAIGREFTAGCIKNGMTPELANQLFEIIKSCGRYLFNLSHAMLYADIGYKTAWLKYHYPKQFLATYLSYADEKADKEEEINDLANEFRIFGTDILTPNINKKNNNFAIEDGSIRYGLGHIKYIGATSFEFIKTLPLINNWKQVIWLGFTDNLGKQLGKNPMTALIMSGAFSDVGLSRRSLLNIYETLSSLSDKELGAVLGEIDVVENISDLPKIISQIGESFATKNRKEKVRSIAQLLNTNDYDDPAWIQDIEHKYLFTPITATSSDKYSNESTDRCADCQGKPPVNTERDLIATIKTIYHTETKKGKNPGQKMARLIIFDSSGTLENIPVFPRLFAEVSDLLVVNSTIGITIKYKENGWVAEKVYEVSPPQ